MNFRRRFAVWVVVVGVAACGGRVDGSTPCPDPSAVPERPPPATPAPPSPPSDDLSDTHNWSTFETGGGFNGAAFDGRYVYLVPGGTGVVPRFDTRGDFSDARSWSSFDTTRLDARAGGYRGAAFDGRYLYFVPYHTPSALDGFAVRYDTRASFGSADAWSTFDITSVDPRATGFLGATFDGRYLYLVPYGDDAAPEGVVARFDTWSSFTSQTSWSTFDTATLGDQVKGFLGATFDGRYVYFSPYGYSYGDYGSMVTRFDTLGSFTDVSSWSTFDTTRVSSRALGFFGASSDGRYDYFVPYNGDGSRGGMIARYDTTNDFAQPASWSVFDTSPLGVGPAGAVYDGRYLYLVPSATPADEPAGGSGLVARLDTAAGFADRSSWTTFDTTKLDPRARWFFGGAFDGEYVYFAPSLGSVAVRFHARTSPSMPSAWHGSFY
jgi:hypothetical protein